MWLEAITVRTPKLDDLERQLATLLGQLAADSQDVEVTAYVRCGGNNDLSFHLVRSTESAEPTALGLTLAEALRSYGTVDHAVWRSVTRSDGEQALSTNSRR